MNPGDQYLEFNNIRIAEETSLISKPGNIENICGLSKRIRSDVYRNISPEGGRLRLVVFKSKSSDPLYTVSYYKKWVTILLGHIVCLQYCKK